MIILFLYSLIGCKDKDIIRVPLDMKTGNLPAFNSEYLDFPFLFLHEEYRKYYKYQISSYKNIPKGDILYLATSYGDYRKFIYELQHKNLIDSHQYQLLSQRLKLDSTIEAKKSRFFQIVIATGLKEGKQFVVTDANNDSDFGNEEFVLFDSGFSTDSNNHKSQLEKVPTITYTYDFYVEDTLETYHRKIKIFPKPDYYAFQRVVDTMAKKLGVIGRFQDYWKGSITVNENEYDVAIQGFNSDRHEILIKHDSLTFSDNDFLYNDNFRYQINDTIQLSKKMFRIVRVDKPINNLFLKEIDAAFVQSTGNILGKIINDYKLMSLDGDKFSLYQSNTKKYTLIDFWGTWCEPCTELTPNLKALHNNYSKNLNIIGIAIDQSPEKVKAYTLKNQMNWKQAFFDIRKENSILNSLKITGYPTLILIDANHKIVYRGGTQEALNKIEEIIKKN